MTRKDKLWNKNFVVVLAVMMVANMGFYMLAPIITPYVVSMGYTLALAGVVTGMMSIVAMCIRPFTGLVGDLFNKKYLLMIFSALSALALLGYTLTTSFPMLIAIRVLHGIAFSITTTVAMVVSGESVPVSRMGEGMGYFGVAQGVASAIGPNLGLTIANRAGYHAAMFTAVGFTFLGVAIIFILDNPPKVKVTQKLNMAYIRHNFIAKEVFPFFLINFCLGSFGGLESSFLALYTTQLGLMDIGWYFTVSAIVLIVSKFALGRITDKHSFTAALVFGASMVGIALLLLGTLRASIAVPTLIVTAVIRSLGIGVLQPALQAASLKAVPDHRRSAASSTFFLETDLGVGSAPMVGAALQERFDYSGMYLVYIAPLVASVFLYLGLKKKKQKGVQVETD